VRAVHGRVAFILAGGDTRYAWANEAGVPRHLPDREDVMHRQAFTIERIAVLRALPLECAQQEVCGLSRDAAGWGFRAETRWGSGMLDRSELTMAGKNGNGADGEGGDGEGKTGLVTKTRPKTKRPSLYKVLLLNDDYTPMEFVVHVLERFFNKGREDATRIMLHVHHKGVGICGVYTYEIAETKVAQVMDFARQHQHPLQCTMEKE
jgi:ATP-dependent Clp protease adaptor protein ClpS